VLDYAYGRTPVANGLIAAYALPAVAFAYAAYVFRQRADDLLVATLEAGAVTFATFFVALEIRHGFNEGAFIDEFGFNEIALHMLTLSIQSAMYLHLAQRTGRPMFAFAWQVLGSIALAVGAVLLVINPMVSGAHTGFPGLLAAYLAPAALAVFMRRSVTNPPLRKTLAVYALVAGFAWITLQIRQAFHPTHPGVIFGSIDDAELWAWSGAWLAYGIGLMVLGIRLNERMVRLASLGVVGLVCAKVFLIDMSDLTGLWRVLSFLGLGLALIGLGAVHRRFVLPARPTLSDEDEAEMNAPV
jgi:uncharacterized membrane protein